VSIRPLQVWVQHQFVSATAARKATRTMHDHLARLQFPERALAALDGVGNDPVALVFCQRPGWHWCGSSRSILVTHTVTITGLPCFHTHTICGGSSSLTFSSRPTSLGCSNSTDHLDLIFAAERAGDGPRLVINCQRQCAADPAVPRAHHAGY